MLHNKDSKVFPGETRQKPTREHVEFFSKENFISIGTEKLNIGSYIGKTSGNTPIMKVTLFIILTLQLIYVYPGIDLTCFLTDLNDAFAKRLCCPGCVCYL